MKISVNWLRNYVNLPDQNDWQAFGDLLTVRTAEVEEVANLAGSYDKMVIGQIESIRPHSNADKLKVTMTKVGSETLQIVCGASNIFEGQKVAVALVGAKVRWHGEGDLVELQPAKIRGEESFGMICAASEIGLKDEVDGIMDLSHLKAAPGTPLAVALEKNDIIIDIENKTLTHRPDLWGHYGMAREIAAITGEKLKPVEVFNDYHQDLPEIIKVQVKDPDLCPRYLTVTIDNIKVGPSPEWLRTALENTGNRSINNIVDATNFVMLELGNPLHAFDTAAIKDRLIIRRAKKGEVIETLDQEKKELDSDILIIADAEKPLAIAGIKGGLHSGITDRTTRITLEAANFNPVNNRKSSVKLGIRTEAVQRFEKDLDPLLAEQAMDRLVKIILDLCPEAKVISKKQDISKFRYKPRRIKLDLAKASSKIGIDIDALTATDLLEKLEFKVTPGKKQLTVEVPSFRATKDINHEADLVEEIARLYGYEKIPSVVPELHVRPAPRLHTERREKYDVRNILSLELGMNETMNYSFYSKKTLENCGLDESVHMKIRNYLSEEQTHLRVSLIPNLLYNVSQNLKNFGQMRLYEIGRTYKFINSYFPLEEKNVAGLIVLDRKSGKAPFYEAKTAVEILLRRLNISSLKYRRAESANPLAHPAKHAAWFDFKSQQEIIQIFELHPEVAQNFGLEKYPVACFTVNYSLLHHLDRAERRYRPIPKFPSIQFDISMMVEADREVASFEKAIRAADSSLISQVKLFDFYQGGNIPVGKKSLAYQITLQAADRTLTDQEMKQIQESIFTNLKKEGAEIRGL
jgi:phenylalanyl-tRNA synthetase beta chain